MSCAREKGWGGLKGRRGIEGRRKRDWDGDWDGTGIQWEGGWKRMGKEKWVDGEFCVFGETKQSVFIEWHWAIPIQRPCGRWTRREAELSSSGGWQPVRRRCSGGVEAYGPSSPRNVEGRGWGIRTSGRRCRHFRPRSRSRCNHPGCWCIPRSCTFGLCGLCTSAGWGRSSPPREGTGSPGSTGRGTGSRRRGTCGWWGLDYDRQGEGVPSRESS